MAAAVNSSPFAAARLVAALFGYTYLMRSIAAAERRTLRAKAHHLHPVVMVGQHGLTPAVLHEIDLNLIAHELIKIRVFSDERVDREALLERICTELDAAPVQHIGKLFVIWRPAPEQPAAKPAGRQPSRIRGADKVASTQQRTSQPKSRSRVLPMGKSAPQARRPREPSARGSARLPNAVAAKSPRAGPVAPTAGAKRRRRAV